MSTKMQQQVACNGTSEFVTFFATLDDKTLQRKELGEWLKLHREKANLSQETAAEQSGLSRYQWMRLENGQSGTKRETLIQIAKTINADINQTLKKGGYSELFISEGESLNGSSDGAKDFDEKVRAAFQGASNWSDEEKERVLKAVRTFVAGVRAEREANTNQ